MRPPFTPTDVERFRAAIARGLGLELDDSRTGLLLEVLGRRVEARREHADAYLSRLERSPASELPSLARELTVGETYFFRNHEQFQAFRDVALPARIRARASERTLRLLSAGCASGEEAYSLAIVALETVDPSWKLSIVGIDVNPGALEKAATARFSPWALRETPPEIERRWFKPEGRQSVLDPNARAQVTFEGRNLIDGDPLFWRPDHYDVIFCRNVLMYLTPENAQAVVGRIARSLAPGGYLFLGHAETLRGLSAEFHLRHTHETFYYERREERERDAPLSRPAATTSSSGPATASLIDAVDDAGTWVEAIRRASERVRTLTDARSSPPAPVSDARAEASGAALAPVLELMEQERYGEALDRVGALASPAANDPDALLLRAILLTQRGLIGEAEKTCARLLAADELSAGAHYTLALCREGAGDRRGAIEHDQVAVYLDPSFAMPRLHLGLAAKRNNEPDVARRELGQALVLLQREDASRLLLFGGGFRREALVALCKAELTSLGEANGRK